MEKRRQKNENDNAGAWIMFEGINPAFNLKAIVGV
jgi:hypothetical protein